MTSACSSTQEGIDDRLLPYFNRFIAEATQRGKVLSLDNIEGQIVDIQEKNIVAQCTHYQSRPNLVRLDKDYWNTGSEMDKEFYIFHELGHCLLNRDHLDLKDQNGNCLSIMHSTTTVCNFTYSSQNRSQYLDELFK
jgi:hypothetical protein